MQKIHNEHVHVIMSEEKNIYFHIDDQKKKMFNRSSPNA